MKVHLYLRLLEERERTQIIADQFRQLRIDQRDDLARVQRDTNGTTEFVEYVQLPGPLLEVVALGLQQTFLFTELLIGGLQLLIDFLQIAGEAESLLPLSGGLPFCRHPLNADTLASAIACA
jgi:hypothetical protein